MAKGRCNQRPFSLQENPQEQGRAGEGPLRKAVPGGRQCSLVLHHKPFPMEQTPPPAPINHTAEMVIATVFGVMYGLKNNDYLTGIFVGVVAGVVLSMVHTWVVRRRKGR